MPENKRPDLRDCPFCHAKGSDEETVFFSTNTVILSDGDSYDSHYMIRCIGCGVELSDEYESEVVRLWNGKLPESDNEEDGA